ncbi:MAG: hypothetical protein U9Q81_02420 [Pseudomonadota bacterium]|nr:hypothetical protein [Pseudomonadota bacterium]
MSIRAGRYRFFIATGVEIFGDWGTDGYEFKRSQAVVNGRFVGLALDQHLQHLLTDQRIDAWLDDLLPERIIEAPTAVAATA